MPSMSMSCLKCNGKLGKSDYKIKCSGSCKKWVHKKCMKVKEDEFKLILKGNKWWFCEACKSEVSFGGPEQENEPLSANEEDNDDSVDEDLYKTPTIKDVMQKLEYMDKKYDVMINKIVQLEAENKELKKEIELLKENQNIARNKEKQNQLQKNVVINGIATLNKSMSNNELITIVQKIGDASNTKIEREDIDGVEVFGETEKLILKIKFSEEETKEKLMKAIKIKKGIRNEEIGSNGEEGSIYINHDLTKEHQLLYKKCRDLKKNNNFKFVWYKKGSFLLRKTEKSKVITINDERDLDKIMQSNF